VNLWGNFGPVQINGNSTTGVNLGWPLSSTGTITSGIEANVGVQGASHLVIDDSGNTSTFENVKVTEHTISTNSPGASLFGNDAVTLTYGGVGSVEIHTGQEADTYTVAPSSPNATFTSSITIDNSNSFWGFRVNVTVDAASSLNLTLNNKNPIDGAVLDLTNGFGALPVPNGTISVSFPGQATSVINYDGFANVF
jgi:hypothetical protein